MSAEGLTTLPNSFGPEQAMDRDGDMVELDVAGRRLHLAVDEAELARRKARWTPPKPQMEGGYQSLYVERVLQADQGADLDFLVGCRGAAIPRESH